jgi:hypothetical protein
MSPLLSFSVSYRNFDSNVEIEIPITVDNFNQKFRRKSKLISIGIPIEIPAKLIPAETLVLIFLYFLYNQVVRTKA